jgi:malate dehydrogenase (oxaloacetate-decarboxylating)(NADP+)
VLKPEWLPLMDERPLILALANPEPEIMPDVAKAARPDAVIATGRSDFPNQVNNVLCFPFIFRGALDVGATTINEAMKLAAVRAIADLAMAEQSEVVAHAYNLENIRFGPDYLIPKPFDRGSSCASRRPSRRRRWIPASRRGRSRTSTRTCSGSRSSCTSRAC